MWERSAEGDSRTSEIVWERSAEGNCSTSEIVWERSAEGDSRTSEIVGNGVLRGIVVHQKFKEIRQRENYVLNTFNIVTPILILLLLFD